MMLLAAGALITVLASPSPSPAPVVDVETGVAHESLTNGRPPWNSQYILLTAKNADHQTMYLQLSSNQRFNANDDQILLGAYIPIGERWTATAEANASNTHYILPAESVDGGIQYASGGGFIEGLSLRHTDYDTASVNSAVFTAEHYWRNYRLAYNVVAAHVAGTGTDVEQSIAADRYYGKQNSYAGVGYTNGTEVDNVGLPQLVTSHVRGWNVTGKNWFTDVWGLSYGAGTFVQGSFYTRTGGRVAVDYRF